MTAPDGLRAAMALAGLNYPGPITADGKLRRFRADGDHGRNSWYVLHAGPPAAGAFGCWRRGIKETWYDRNGQLSQANWQHVRRQWREADVARQAAERDRQTRARKTAKWILARSKPADAAHLYLAGKGVGVHGELCQRGDLLVVPLRDAAGQLQTVQFIAAGKRFDGARDKSFLPAGKVAGTYFTLADNAGGPLAIVEGYATGASIHEATGCATFCAMDAGNLIAVGLAAREIWPQREIVICGDNDARTPGNPGRAKATAAAKRIKAKLAMPQFAADAPGKPTDFNDLAALAGLPEVKRQLEGATIPAEEDEDVYERLAALPTAEYDRCRDTEAEALNIRVTTLDAEVERRRKWTGGNDSTLQGSALDLREAEPWPQPVDGAEVLSAVSERFSRYVALPPGAADALALWVCHTHCFEAFIFSPRLNITSPEKECGKTSTLDLVALFVPRPLATENMTTAVLFRVVAARKPVILADEYDSWLRDNEELRGLLNAGHKRGGQATRCEGDNHEVRAFHVFGPAVLAGIGALPGTLASRSIIIRLARAKPGEVAHRFDSRRADVETTLCRKLARWCADHESKLEDRDPSLPDGASNRLADNWRVLMAIAEVAEGDWPRRAAEAYRLLTAGHAADDTGLGTRLLADMRDIFEAAWPEVDRLASADLCGRLAALPEAPWAEYAHGRPLTPQRLARLLWPYGVRSRNIRLADGTTPKGYQRDDLADAWARYLPDSCPRKRHNATTRTSIDESAQNQNATDPPCGVLQNVVSPNNDGPCGAVAFPKAGSEEIDTIATL